LFTLSKALEYAQAIASTGAAESLL
jgi:hypothetical protein